MANPELDNYVSEVNACDQEHEQEMRRAAKKLLATTIDTIKAMGYHVNTTTSNSDVDIKAFAWFTLEKIK